jgi:hypothetical protein
MQEAILALPERVWEPACDTGGRVRPGHVGGRADRPAGPGLLAGGDAVIVRRERPRPGAQLRLPTSAGAGSPPSPPTPRAGSSRTWNCATAAAHAARTGSALPMTPGCVTSPSEAPRRTRYGASRSPWPASSPPGYRCSLFRPTFQDRETCTLKRKDHHDSRGRGTDATVFLTVLIDTGPILCRRIREQSGTGGRTVGCR